MARYIISFKVELFSQLFANIVKLLRRSWIKSVFTVVIRRGNWALQYRVISVN